MIVKTTLFFVTPANLDSKFLTIWTAAESDFLNVQAVLTHMLETAKFVTPFSYKTM